MGSTGYFNVVTDLYSFVLLNQFLLLLNMVDNVNGDIDCYGIFDL